MAVIQEFPDTDTKTPIQEVPEIQEFPDPTQEGPQLSPSKPSLYNRLETALPSIFSRSGGSLPSTSETAIGVLPRIIKASGESFLDKLVPEQEVKPEDSVAHAVGKETLNLAMAIPKFATSPQGFATFGAGKFLNPKLISLAFAANTYVNIGKEILDLHKNWGSMSAGQKAAAVEEMAGNGFLAGLLTKHVLTKPKGVQNAQAIRGDKGQLPPQGKVIEGVKETGGHDVEQAAPGKSQPVGARAEAKVPLKEGNPYQVLLNPDNQRWVVVAPNNDLVADTGGYATQNMAINAANELHTRETAATAGAEPAQKVGEQTAPAAAPAVGPLRETDFPKGVGHPEDVKEPPIPDTAPAVNSLITDAAKAQNIPYPIEAVDESKFTDPKDPNNPFSGGGGVFTIIRDEKAARQGRIIFSRQRFDSWVADMQRDGMSSDQIRKTIESTLLHETDHLKRTPEEGEAFYNTRSKPEIVLNNRIYGGPGRWLRGIGSRSNQGLEMMARLSAQFGGYDTHEVAQSVGREKLTLKTLVALENSFRRIRQLKGSAQSKLGDEIFNRQMANIAVAKAIVAQQPGSAKRNGDDIKKNVDELRDAASQYRASGDEASAAEMEQMAKSLEQKGDEQAFPMSANRKKTDPNQQVFDGMLKAAGFSQMRAAMDNPKLVALSDKQKKQNALNDLLPREPGSAGRFTKQDYSPEDLKSYVALRDKLHNTPDAAVNKSDFMQTWKDMEAVRNKYGGMPPANLQQPMSAGRKKSRSESVNQDKMSFAGASVNPVEEAQKQIPMEERVSAEAAGALPPLSAADLDNRADKWVADTFKKTIEKEVKSVRRIKKGNADELRNTAAEYRERGNKPEADKLDKLAETAEKGGQAIKSLVIPKFDDFVEHMKHQQESLQPGQLQEMWQTAIFQKLHGRPQVGEEGKPGYRPPIPPATDDEIRGLASAMLSEVSSAKTKAGAVTKWGAMARAALSFKGDETLKQGALLPGTEDDKGPAFRERYKQPLLVDKKGKVVRPERDLNEEAAKRQDIKESKAATRRRQKIVAEIYNRLVLPASNKDINFHPDKVTPSDIRFGGGKVISSVQDFTPSAEENPETLGKELVDESRRSSEDPVTATKRLTAIMDRKSGRVSLVSTYRHPTRGTMLLDPVSPQQQHAPLDAILRRYRVVQSILLDQPVQKFKQDYASLKEYNDEFGKEARDTYASETSYDLRNQPKEVEGTEDLEGEGGGFVGPFRAEAMASLGIGPGEVAKATHTPLTPTEAAAVLKHVHDEFGHDPQSIDDVRAAVDNLSEGSKPEPAAVTGFVKIAQYLLNKHPDLSADDLKGVLAQTIFNDKALHMTQEETKKAATRKEPVLPLKQPSSSTARDLTMRDRVPPTVQRPENLPAGMEPQKFTMQPPVPEGTPGKVTPPVMMTPEEAQHVNAMALQSEKEAAKLTIRQRVNAGLGSEPERAKFDYTKEYYPRKKGEPMLLREQSPMSAVRRAKEHTLDELDKKVKQLTGAWLRRATNKDITGSADGADNDAILVGEQTRKHLQLVNKDPMMRSSPLALLSCGKIGENPNTGKKFFFYDRKEIDSKIVQAQLGATKAEEILNDPKSDRQLKKYARQWKAGAEKLQAIATYVRDHWDDKSMRDMNLAVRQELYDQLGREHEAGVSTSDFGEYYFPTRYEGEMFNLNAITFGEDKTIGKRFTAQKKFRDHYDAIMHGPFVPKSYDAADIVGHRVRQGMKAVVRASWKESLKDMKDAVSGKPLAMSAKPSHPQRLVNPDTGEEHFHPGKWEPPTPEYDLVYPQADATPIAVLRPYSKLVKLCSARSAFQDSPVGEGALYLSSMLKHGVVLVGDTFHPTRLMQYASGITGRVPSYQSGFAALMYRPEDLAAAVKSGAVHPDSAKWAMEKVLVNKNGEHTLMAKHEILRDMVRKGLNATRIGDALYKNAIQKIPVVGGLLYKGVGRYNSWLFDRVMPGLISDSAVRSFEKLHTKNPDVPYDKLMRDVITDMNTFYGNLGRQGVFTNPTFRDAAQVLVLAPMWQEGLIAKEARFLGRLTGISNLTGRRGLPQMGALGGGMLKGLAAYFVLTQAINLVTRRQLTFQNKEKGHELDAWIPTGKDTGLWLSPMSVFAEKTHDLIRLSETKPKTWDAINQMGENVLGPVGRFEEVLRTSRSPTGEYLTSTPSVLKAAVEQLAPVPISAGQPLKWGAYYAGIGKKPEPGSFLRQAIASGGGTKTEMSRDVTSRVQTAANDFVKANDLKFDPAVIIPTEESSYAKLRHAIKIGDEGSAAKIMADLQKKRTNDQIIHAMKDWAKRPFTGSHKNDRLWLHSMNEDQMAEYTQAVSDRQELLNKWEDWYLKQRAAQ